MKKLFSIIGVSSLVGTSMFAAASYATAATDGRVSVGQEINKFVSLKRPVELGISVGRYDDVAIEGAVAVDDFLAAGLAFAPERVAAMIRYEHSGIGHNGVFGELGAGLSGKTSRGTFLSVAGGYQWTANKAYAVRIGLQKSTDVVYSRLYEGFLPDVSPYMGLAWKM